MENYGFENIILEPEQKQLLSVLVEASRNIPRHQRRPFFISSTQQGRFIQHHSLPDLHSEVYMGDVRQLGHKGLIDLTYPGPGPTANLDVTPEGVRYYEWMKQREGQPIQRIEIEIKTYLNADDFHNRHQAAYQKWTEAESMLWGSDSKQQLTTIGHLCREAVQEFATALVERHHPPEVDENKAHTRNRLKAVLAQQADWLGETERPFLDALIDYWEAFEKLIQRQEHGGQKEGEALVWEDGRRVVFQTAVVMYEIDRALSYAQRG
jgi:hypothetical protein